ncbi:MAG: hypothetical protein ABIO02_04570, partial [Patescibacteria group bacterium]
MIAFSFVHTTLAADFTTNYKVDYYLDENNGSPLTKVKMRVDVLNHTPDSYISKFSISFPKLFKIDNVSALYKEPITPRIETEGDATTLLVDLPPPTLADKTRSTIYFDFYQENLFKITGNVWEVILPTIQLQDKSEYDITLHIPENSKKRLSISKPKPSTNDGNTITWHNPDVKTIYTTFGAQQYYDLNLKYHLQNDDLRRVYTEIAFPPDSLYQKIYIDQIDPKPAEISIDEDGNFIGKYYLNPKESKDIVFKGTAELYSLPRADVKIYQSKKINEQKSYLLSTNKYWSLDNNSKYTTPEEIFSYVATALKYDIEHVNDDKK